MKLNYLVMLFAFFVWSTSVKSATSLLFVDEYTTEIMFPANFHVGDYIEFVRVAPIAAGASGNYEISIAYTRGSIAAAATYLASITHSNPNLWREVGRTNSNGYVTPGSENHNFTIDCNTEYANPRFRIRAINTGGVPNQNLYVSIKIRSINYNASWTSINQTGTDLTVNKFLPMTNDWSLYVGNTITSDGANIAIKAIENGNVGIGTTTPTEKLAVNGKIRAREIKVENANWPDFVFAKSYMLPTLKETEKHIKEKGHLPGIPSATEVKANGVDLGEMNAKLLQKIEELTLYVIEMKKENEAQNKKIDKLEEIIKNNRK